MLKERKNGSAACRSANDDEAEFGDDLLQRDSVAVGEVGVGNGEDVVRIEVIVVRFYALFEWFVGAEDGIRSVAFATWLK